MSNEAESIAQRAKNNSPRTHASWLAYKKKRKKSGPSGRARSKPGEAHLVPQCGSVVHKTDVNEPIRYCKQQAGAGTDHFGEGRCKYHGGNSGVKHGRYSQLKNTEIGGLIDKHMEDDDPLNLVPELAAARAMFEDWIERYEDFSIALIHWHESFEEGNFKPKPMQIMDIADINKLLETISKITDRITKAKNVSAVSIKELIRVMAEMGRVVETYVKDPEQISKIREGFLSIKVRT